MNRANSVQMNISLINHKCITKYGCPTCNNKKHNMKLKSVFLALKTYIYSTQVRTTQQIIIFNSLSKKHGV